MKDFKIEVFLRRFWPALLAGAVFVIALIGAFFYFVLQGNSGNTASASSTVVLVATSTVATPTSTRALDGMPVSPDEVALQPFAVMVENIPEARPLMGPAKANVVIEAPVEGGVTRFMLLFDATSTVDQIGPVRSARPYFVDWADGLEAVYAHVGGSPEALDRIATLSSFRNLDQFFNGPYFWRTTKRSAPHNVFTRMDLLREVATVKEWSPAPFRRWSYLTQETTSTERGDGQAIEIPYGGSYDVSWHYDTEANNYQRYQGAAAQRDADEQGVLTKNVIVLLTDGQVLDNQGRLRLKTIGSGKAVLFRDGQRFDITWHRSAREWISFESIDGGEVLFEPGQTWISVVMEKEMMP